DRRDDARAVGPSTSGKCGGHQATAALCGMPDGRCRCRHRPSWSERRISSYLSEILAVSDRILVARGGRIVEVTPAAKATEENLWMRPSIKPAVDAFGREEPS